MLLTIIIETFKIIFDAIKEVRRIIRMTHLVENHPFYFSN